MNPVDDGSDLDLNPNCDLVCEIMNIPCCDPMFDLNCDDVPTQFHGNRFWRLLSVFSY